MLLFLLMLGGLVAVFLIGLSVVKHFSKGLPDVGSLKGYEPSQTTRIHSSTGETCTTKDIPASNNYSNFYTKIFYLN